MQINIISKDQINILIENENKSLDMYYKKLNEQSTFKGFTEFLDKFIEKANYKKYLLETLENK